MKTDVVVARKGDIVMARGSNLVVIYETSGDVMGVLTSTGHNEYQPTRALPRAVDGSIVYMQEGETKFKQVAHGTTEAILQNFICGEDYQNPYVVMKLTEEDISKHYNKIPTI